MRLYEDRFTADRNKSKTFWFVAVSKIKTSGMTSKTFLKKVDIWKKLPFVNLPKRKLSESYKKRQEQINKNLSKVFDENKKIAEMRKKEIQLSLQGVDNFPQLLGRLSDYLK